MAHEEAIVFPAIRYRDAGAAIEWLCTALGFERKIEVPGPDDTVAHAELRLGSGVVMVGTGPENGQPAPPADPRAARHGIYVYVQDVDAHYERARSAGAEVVMPLAETEYASREYAVRDPEGNYWSFGTYRP